MLMVTRKGDVDVTHCTGMVRSAASSNVFVNGIGVSRQGDNNTTHLLPPNVATLSLIQHQYQVVRQLYL